MDGVEVVFGVLGEGIRLAHQAADPRSQGAKPAFDVVGLSFLLAAATMGAGRERRRAGFPEVAAGSTPLVILWQRRPQVAGALQASVAQGPSDHLAGSSAQRHPQPELAGFAADKTPKFVQFEHITLLAGQERIRESRQSLHFSPPPTG